MMIESGIPSFWFVWIPLAAISAIPSGAAPDTPFTQEYHQRYVIGDKPPTNDVRAVAVDAGGSVWAATKAGVYRMAKGQKRWSALLPGPVAGPAFDIAIDGAGAIWVGVWNGIYRSTPDGLEKIDGIDHPIAAVCADDNGADDKGIVAIGPEGLWRIGDGKAVRRPIPCARTVRAVLSDRKGGLWIATQMGLYHHTDAGDTCYRSRDQLLSADVRDVAYAPDGSLWIGGLGGVTLHKNAKRIGQFTPAQGLPSIDVRSVRCAPDGTMWIGTALGAARYDGKSWSLRHGRRWLAGDDVRDVFFEADGTAWIATNGGVSAIKRRKMTLEAKADHYLRVCLARHVREPGLVEKCRLTVPGDTTTWQPQDDDNDGQYTSMYLAMESFRYAATKDPRAKTNANRAFGALRFLQTVTGTSGFVARTVVPVSWTRMHDPNRVITDPEWADRHVADPRNKRVPVRWRPSADGKWLWKGDTSSDEITGHYFGYLFYYDLVADEAERKHVRAHVRKITDYIVDNGYVLKDIDGTHTRWGVWAPEKLNDDPDWATERGVNSVEMLSFLKVAYHMTDDEKYQQRYLDLIRKHGYAENARRAKTLNPSWRTHIDDELLALAYPALLKYETDPELRRIYRESLDYWYAAVRDDRSPFFNFIYGSLVGKDSELQHSIAFLRDAPLDLVRWRVDNSRRQDIRLTRFPEMEMLQTHRLVPPSERGMFRWDRNPWAAVQGDGGHTESDGVFWLLPYWMGRHYGFIQPQN